MVIKNMYNIFIYIVKIEIYFIKLYINTISMCIKNKFKTKLVHIFFNV